MRLTPYFLRLLLDNEILHNEDGFNGALDGLYVALSTEPLPESGDVSYALDVALPTYDGYADLACAFSDPHVNEDGDFCVDGPLLTFQEAGDLTTTTIQAIALYFPTSGNPIIGIENLDTPITLATADDAFQIVPQVAVGITDGGHSTVVS